LNGFASGKPRPEAVRPWENGCCGRAQFLCSASKANPCLRTKSAIPVSPPHIPMFAIYVDSSLTG
jgi:hypothetical protein